MKKFVHDKFPIYVTTGFLMVLSLSEDNSTDLDSVGRVLVCGWALRRKHRSCQEQNAPSLYLSLSDSYRLRGSVCMRLKVQFLLSPDHT